MKVHLRSPQAESGCRPEPDLAERGLFWFWEGADWLEVLWGLRRRES